MAFPAVAHRHHEDVPATLPVPSSRPRLWGGVALVVAVCVAGALGVLACGLGWMLMGFMGTAVEPWEPVAYPAGAAACVLVPALVGGRVLGARGARLRWGLAAGAGTVVTAGLVAVPLLGIAA